MTRPIGGARLILPNVTRDFFTFEQSSGRVTYLGSLRDPDDVPSATLAIAIGAFFLTEDIAPYEAVHGIKVDAAVARQWLAPLRDGGDSAELHELFSLSLAVPMVGIGGLWTAARWLHARSPIALTVIGVMAGLALAAVPISSYQKAWTLSKDITSRLSDEIVMPQLQASARVRSTLPPFPAWATLVDGTTKDAALMRACLYRLSRSRKAPMRAGELADELPSLGIGQSASRIGKVLRAQPCFFQPYAGLWQVGRPHDAKT